MKPKKKNCNPYGSLIHLKSAHSYNEGRADMETYYQGSELGEGEIEKVIKNTSLTSYEFTHPFENKQICQLSGNYLPNKLAKAIISARAKKRGE